MKRISCFLLLSLLVCLPGLVTAAGLVSVWTQRYDYSSGNDIGYGLTLGTNGNVYVTGLRSSGGERMVTIKYSNTGRPGWTNTFLWGSVSGGKDIAWCTTNLYLSGYCDPGGISDYLVMRMNLRGQVILTQRYDFPGAAPDSANAVAIDPVSRNYYVAGLSTGGPRVYLLRKRNVNTSAWTQMCIFSSMAGEALALDGGQRPWVAMTSNDNLFLKAYNTNGSLYRRSVFDSGFADLANRLIFDNNSLYATVAWKGSADWLVLKFNAGGTNIWQRSYDSGSGSEAPRNLCADAWHSVYACGDRNNGSDRDAHIVKYDQDGNELWSMSQGLAGSDERWEDIAVDRFGYIYVTGVRDNDMFTAKYIQPPFFQPLSLSAATQGGDVLLTWSDNSTNETGYKVYRSTNGVLYTYTGSTPAGTLQFLDTSLPGTNQYWYRVTATNIAGESLPSSPASVIYGYIPPVAVLEDIPAPVPVLSQTVLVPNPYSAAKETRGYITFFHVPPDARIRIFNIKGDKEADLPGPDREYKVRWEPKDSSGRSLGRGLYFARLEDSKGGKRSIRFVIGP